MTDDDQELRESKLPRWARHELVRLRANLTSAHRQLDEMTGDGPNENVWLEKQSANPGRYVGDDWKPTGFRRARFYTGPRRLDYIEVRTNDDGTVNVMAGNSRLVVQPSSGNVINVSPERS